MQKLVVLFMLGVTCGILSGCVMPADNAVSRNAASPSAVTLATKRCPADEVNQAHWLDIRSRANEVNGDQFALTLADCLASPNSTLRDRIGYELLTHWLRKESLSSEVKRGLVFKLQPWLASNSNADAATDSTIARAFSALVLSELVRSDAAKPFLSDDELEQLVVAATLMFASERDYRGLDSDIGWIHAVAHGSDLLGQLASHPALSSQQLDVILESLASQYLVAKPPPFVFNEADRVAKVVVALSSNSKLEPLALEHWLERIADPAELSTWSGAFNSVQGMYKLHNTKALLRAIREELAVSGNNPLISTIDTHLNALP